ncbi:MAG: hypothetical protein Q7S27_05185 [Nanoarchaeota archaeon]|nr:hypothetical protein [Nanoarchaeota archaeon]
MVLEETAIADILKEIGLVGLWIQAVGLIIILWIIFQIIILVNNRIRRKQLYEIENRLKKIESKINQLVKKKT